MRHQLNNTYRVLVSNSGQCTKPQHLAIIRIGSRATAVLGTGPDARCGEVWLSIHHHRCE